LFVFISFNLNAQTVIAPQKDSLVGDHQAIGVANPKDTIRYKTKISVSGTTATSVNFSNLIPANTTYVAGSLKTSALSRDDNFATSFNTLLNTGNVLDNDFGLPSVTVVSFGTTASNGTTTMAGNAGTTNGGGTLTVNANGTFSYLPMIGFSGMDQFTYVSTTGVPGSDNGSGTVTIDVAPDIVFSTMDDNPTCNGESTGSITFNAMGGSGTLMYSINGIMGSFQASPIFSGLAAGTYDLVVKDAVGYTKTGTTTLSQPSAISFTTTDVNNVCNGGMAGSITFNAMGGTGALTYSISGAMGPYQIGTAYSGLASGLYNLAVKDANNCIVTGTTTITEPTAVAFTFTKTDITCNGAGNGSIVFNTTMGGTSPYTYSINGTMGTFAGTTSYTGLSANTYNLVAKDNVGCNSAVQSTTVIEPAAIVVSGNIPNLTYNVAMSNAPFTKTGGSGSPATPWAASGLPTGININTSTGIVNGTPTQTGMFTATITYTDANGCTDDIMVSFNVAPRLQNESFAVVGNTQLVSNGHSTPTTPHTTNTTNILTNDQSDAAITVTAGTFATTNMGGSITIGSDGKFIYSPPAGSTATDSYTYTGTSNGVSATATITFNIANMVWYVNNTNGGAADGRSHSPFTTCNAAASASAINQIIYVHRGSGNTTGNAILKSGQTLRGSGNSLTVGALTIPAGTKPTLSNTITLANSVIVDGFDMSTGLGVPALSSSGATSVNVNIGNITTNFASNSVTLANTTGSVSIAGGSFVGGGGATINISGGSVTFTYGGSVNQGTTSEAMVSISGGHTGTVNFNTGTLTATNGTGLQFDNADGTYNFNGTVTLNGGDAGIDILNGSGGIFSFPSININNTAGTGVNISSSSAGITFASLGVTTTNGSCIIANEHTGSFTVTNGTGNLSATNGAAINFFRASGFTQIDLKFTNITVTNSPNYGIRLDNVGGTGLSITGATTTLGLSSGTNNNILFENINGGTYAISSSGILNINGRRDFGIYLLAVTGSTVSFGNTTINNPNSLTVPAIRINSCSGAITFAQTNINMGGFGSYETFAIEYTPDDNSGNGDAIYVTGFTGTAFNINGGTIENAADDGIDIRSSSNFNLSNVIIEDVGLAVVPPCVSCNSSGVQAYNLTGTNNITNSTFRFGRLRNFFFSNASGTSALNISGCTFNDTRTFGGTLATDNLQLYTSGSANVSFDIENSTFLKSATHQINLVTWGNSVVPKFDVTGITMDNDGGDASGLHYDAVDNSNMSFNIMNNVMLHTQDENIITISAANTAQVQGRIQDNPDMLFNTTPTDPMGMIGSVFGGIRLLSDGTSSNVTVLIQNNNMTIIEGQDGMNISVQGNAAANINATVNNNTIGTGPTNPPDDNNLDAINAFVNPTLGGSKTLCFNPTNNTITGIWDRFCRARAFSPTGVTVPGFVTDMITTWNNKSNTAAVPPQVGQFTTGGGTLTAGPACPLPTNPLP